MRNDSDRRIGTETLAAHLEGELTRSEREQVDAALAEDADAQRRLEQVAHIRRVLQRQDSELEGIDLVPGVRRGLLEPPRPRGSARWFAFGGAAVAASVALFVAFKPHGVEPSEFQPRSVNPNATDATRWAGVKIYRLRGHSAPEPLEAGIARGDGLLFAYTNLGPLPFDYLMLFAVEASGRVRWFYPAYERTNSDPQSIRIEHGAAETMLSDVVRQDYAAGSLVVCSLFSRKPLGVRAVEAWLLRQHANVPERAPFADTSLQCVRVEIE